MRSEQEWELFYTNFLDDTAEDLFDNAPCGYISALPDGTIVKVNQTFLSWTGYERSEINGLKRFQDLLTPGGRIFHETHYAPLLDMQGAVREIAVEIERADGSRLPALINSIVKKDAQGRPAVVRTTVFDATHRREYERELLRATKRAEESEARAQQLAKALQQSLIPPAPPQIEGLDVAAAYQPAGRGADVGGDFYDVFELAEGDWAVVVGDVEGKGPHAASVTALVRYTVRAACMRARRPEVVLGMLNEALLRQKVERFCTIVCARLKIEERRVAVTVSSGGHPMPVRVSPQGLLPDAGEPGDLVGVFEEPELEGATVDLNPGDALVFYTDGVPEGRRGSAFFGGERLKSWVNEHRADAARDIADGLVAEVLEFQEGNPRDDVAVVVIKMPA